MVQRGVTETPGVGGSAEGRAGVLGGMKPLPFQSEGRKGWWGEQHLMSPQTSSAVPALQPAAAPGHCGIQSHSPIPAGLWGSPGAARGCSVSHGSSLGSLGPADG